MAYNIWISLQARDILNFLQEHDIDLYQQMQNTLHNLSIEREDFITGAPSKNEAFMVGNWQVYYRVLHRLKSIDVVEIAELP